MHYRILFSLKKIIKFWYFLSMDGIWRDDAKWQSLYNSFYRKSRMVRFIEEQICYRLSRGRKGVLHFCLGWLKIIVLGASTVMYQLKPLLVLQTSHVGTGSNPGCSLLQLPVGSLDKQWKITQVFGPLHSCGRPRGNSCLLASDQPNFDCCGHLGSEPADGRGVYLLVVTLPFKYK